MSKVQGGTETTPTTNTRFSRQQWGLLLMLSAINFTHILDFVIVMPLGDQLRHQLHIDPQQFAAIVSAYGIAAMITGVVTSSFVDRFDRKTVLVSSFAGFVLATFYCGFSRDYFHLLVARCLTGLFGGVAASSVMAIIGDVFPDKQRGKAIGVVSSSFAVASIVGLPIGLSIAIYFQKWNAPFIAIACFAVLILGIAAYSLPRLSGHRSAGRRNPFQQFAAVVRQGNHLWAFGMMLAMVLGTFTIVPFIAPYLQANCGRLSTDMPIIYAAAGACTLVAVNLIGWGTDRFGAKRIFISSALGAVVMTLVVTNLPEVTLFGASLVTSLFMVLASGRSVPAQTMILKASDPELRGAFMNLNTATMHFGTAVGPLITGAIVSEEFEGGPLTHFATAGFVAACFGCLAIAMSQFLRPHRRLEG